MAVGRPPSARSSDLSSIRLLATSSRRRESTTRTASVTAAGPWLFMREANDSARSSVSTDGSLDKSSDLATLFIGDHPWRITPAQLHIPRFTPFIHRYRRGVFAGI